MKRIKGQVYSGKVTCGMLRDARRITYNQDNKKKKDVTFKILGGTPPIPKLETR